MFKFMGFLVFLAHALIKQLSVFGKIHVHEADKDYIPISRRRNCLANSSDAEVNIQCICFLTFLTSSVTTGYIDTVQNLIVLMMSIIIVL